MATNSCPLPGKPKLEPAYVCKHCGRFHWQLAHPIHCAECNGLDMYLGYFRKNWIAEDKDALFMQGDKNG